MAKSDSDNFPTIVFDGCSFAKALAVAFAKQRGGEDVGEAVEEAFNEAERPQKKRKQNIKKD